jgi:hypothetical protein
VQVFSRDRAADPRANLAFRVAVYAYLVFGILDCITTAVALFHGGREGNPLAASLYASYGLMGMFAFKSIVVAFIVFVLTLLPRRIATWMTTWFAATVGFGVIGNLHQIAHLG